VDDIVLRVADPAVSENTCLATGERQTSVPSLQPLQKQCEKPCRYGLPCANHTVEVSRTSGDGTLIAWNAMGAGSELGRQNFRRFGRTTPGSCVPVRSGVFRAPLTAAGSSFISVRASSGLWARPVVFLPLIADDLLCKGKVRLSCFALRSVDDDTERVAMRLLDILVSWNDVSLSEISGANSSAIFGAMQARSQNLQTFCEVNFCCYPTVRTLV
jgi:hypothetical protein